MSQLTNLLIIGGVGYALYTASRKAGGAKKLEFYPESIDVSNVKLTNWVPDLMVRVVNPSTVQQNIEAVFLNVYADSTQIGRIQISTPFKIPKLIDTVVKFPVNLFPAGVGKLAANIIRGKKPKFSIKGTVTSMGITVPIEQTLN